MRAALRILPLLGLACPLLAQAQAEPPIERSDILLLSDAAYVLMPARLALGGEARELAWTHDGRHLVGVVLTPALAPDAERLTRRDPAEPPTPPSASVMVYDMRTGHSRVLRRLTGVDPDTVSIEVIGAGPRVLVTAMSTAEEGEAAFLAEILDVAGGRPAPVKVSPGRSLQRVLAGAGWLALLETDPEGKWSVAFHGADGRRMSALDLPGPTMVIPGGPSEAYLAARPPGEATWLARANPATGEVTRVDRQTWAAGAGTANQPAGPLDVTTVPGRAVPAGAAGATVLLRPTGDPLLRAAEDDPDHGAELSALVAYGPVSMTTLAQNGSAVAFTMGPAVFVRAIDKLDAETGRKILHAIEITETMVRAKQIALAIQMWATDHDDRLPPPDGWAEGLIPYIRDSSLLSGFMWTHTGAQELASIERPSETEIGYLPGRGGRASVRTDGSVRWVPGG
jgi:hypothetical protein